jgi:signal transduction histidine kinase
MNFRDRLSLTALSPGRVGEVLFIHRDELLRRWEQRVLADPCVPDATQLPRPVLHNHVPALLLKIISRLVRHPSEEWGEQAGREIGSDDLGREHARYRITLHYTLEEAMRELSHLRAALLELCDEHAVSMNHEEAILLHTTLDELMTISARELDQFAIRAREQVLATVAHDLRTPLQTVLLQARALERIDSASVHAAGELLERSGLRMLRLVEDLVTLSKADAGQLSIDPVRGDARMVVRDATEELRALAERKRITVRVEQPAEETPLAGDHDRLVQALGNVLGNAIKFTPEGGTVRVILTATAEECVFVVSDSGPGVRPEHLGDIFRPFWQAPGAPKHGVGLGLAIARGVVEAHGGSLTVEAAVGGGATFCLRIPRDGSPRKSMTVAPADRGPRGFREG